MAVFFLGFLNLGALSCRREASPGRLLAALTSATPGQVAVIAALGSRRLIAPRLTGGFAYAPVETTSLRFSSDERKALYKAEKALRKEPSLHAAGVLYLLLGRVREAVSSLERAAEEKPGNAAVLTDLAAAYLVRAESLDQPVDLIGALDAAERAVEGNPACREALFNRALARQRLSLTNQAVEAWREYLGREKDPGWSGEARSALARLQASTPSELWPEARGRLQQAAQKGDQKTVAALVARFPQEVRTFAEEELLDSWADHSRRGDLFPAGADLATARAIGHGLVQLSGESLFADAVADLDRALADDPDRLLSIVEGLAAYREGLRLVKARKFGLAEAPLESARQSLRRAASPFEALASFLLVRCAYQRSDYAEVQSRAREMLRRVDAARYPTLAARVRWVLGTAQMGLARPAEALASYRFALTQFERTGETVNQAAVHSLLASAFNELGDGRSAWQHRARALYGLADHRNPERLRIALTNVAFAALEAGSARAARLVQTEAVNIARDQNDSERLANALLNRASILDRSGLADPEGDLSAARHYCERIEDPSIRQSILADLLAVEGRRLSRKNPAQALTALDKSLEMYQAADRLLMLPEVLGTRAVALQALGQVSGAERDLRSAIEMLEEERGSMAEGEQRASFIERAGAVFDAMVLLQTVHGHAELALEYSERRRARLLLDWLSALPKDIDPQRFRLGTWTHPHALRELRQRMPQGVAVIAYEVLPDRLLLWVVRAETVDQRQVSIPAARLAEQVDRLEQTVTGPESDLREAAAALHDALIAPVAGLLREGETVVFIPESPLYSVPFGLLFDRRRERYLIEDRPFAVAPSLGLFTELAASTGAEDLSRAGILVLANPAFDRSLVQLSRLPGSEEEARSIHDLYPEARIVIGEAAGREALLEGLSRYRILHFGGHALANSGKPLLSSLVLAPRPDREDTGVLYAREIIGPRDSKTDLVVLSACRSAGGAAPPGEGVAGLLWPFFSRGVSMVIASTHEVEDRETASLLGVFYHHLATGEPPATALRSAQLQALTSSRHAEHPSFAWAAFQLYGAVHGTEPSPKGIRK